MKKLRLSSEMFTALAAMLTAVAAVVVSGIQTYIMIEEAEILRREAAADRAHARLSVMPNIMMAHNNGRWHDGRPYIELELSNMGLGPAIVEVFEIQYRGRQMVNQTAWLETIAREQGRSLSEFRGATVSNSFVGPGRVIAAEDRVNPIRVVHEELRTHFLDALEHSELYLCACSMYGDCQEVNGLGDRSRSVATCSEKESQKASDRLSNN